MMSEYVQQVGGFGEIISRFTKLRYLKNRIRDILRYISLKSDTSDVRLA